MFINFGTPVKAEINSKLQIDVTTEKEEYTVKDEVKYSIKLDNNLGYDYVFVANMGKADYYGSSISDEKHLALYIKDTIDDEDVKDGITMRRWYATMIGNGVMVDWEEFV